jgi:hypothetical protein
MPPACPITPPPALAVTWPWQAPFEWLGFVTLAVLTVALASTRLRRLGRFTPPEQLRGRRMLLLAIFVLNLAAAFLLLLVIWPAQVRLDAWTSAEAHQFRDQSCNLSSVYTASAHQQLMNYPVLWLALLIMGIDLALLLVFLHRRMAEALAQGAHIGHM